MKSSSKFKLKYEEKFLAFVDVLGFKDLIPTDSSNSSKIAVIESYFATIQNVLKDLTDRKQGLERMLLSDTIILTYPSHDPLGIGRFQEIALAIAQLQYALALQGIWSRGSLTIGNIHLDEVKNIIVGPALVDAYLMEKESRYPRVVIDPRIIYRFKSTRQEFLKAVNGRAFFEWSHRLVSDWDENEPMFIDYFMGLQRGGLKDCEKLYRAIYNSAYRSNTHYEKYRWLISYFHRCLPYGNPPGLEEFKATLCNL